MRRAMYIQIAAMMLVGLLCAMDAQAATYYVRPDGGSALQCNGLSDSAYPGSGTNQSCAFNHPFWAISPIGNNPTKLQGGDTLIIDGSNGANYKIGFGAPNTNDTSKCAQYWPWDCVMRKVPSGPSPANPTRILGKGWDTGCSNPPELWGTERVKQIFDLKGSDNVELQCLDITDHSDCQQHGPIACNRNSFPFGDWGVWGIVSVDSSNVVIKNVDIHGLYQGIKAARISDWSLEDTNLIANSHAGWNGDVGSGASSNSGVISFNRVKIQYNGCGETYPGKEPHNCYGQSQSGYGDGLGTEQTGGNWIFNEVDFSHNVSDGLDLLYHNGNGSITVKRSRFEGNAGNQLKLATNSVVENSIIIGNCGYFKNKPIVNNESLFTHCRAGGDTVALRYKNNMNVKLYNSTLHGNGATLVMSTGSSCSGAGLESRNNIFLGGKKIHDPGNKSSMYYADGSGSCSSLSMNDDYSVIWNTKHINTDCSGKPHAKCEDPKFEEPFVDFYGGDQFDADLQSSSPARNNAVVLTGMSPLDFNYYDRGATWDSGALEYGSVSTNGNNNTNNNNQQSGPVCGDRVVEEPETCDDGNTVSGDGCSETCQVEPASCGNGQLEAGEQCDDGNTVSWDGCSSACTIEVPVCGNNHIEQGEQCDDGNSSSGDGCSVVCQVEYCGDNIVQSGLDEECDDGNTSSGDGCSSTCQTEQASTSYQLMVSYSNDRSNAVPLSGELEAGNAYIFVTPETNVKRVKFYLDTVSASGSPFQTENHAPYDFRGTNGNGTAAPFNTSSLSPQQHTVTAKVTRSDNTEETISAAFTVEEGTSVEPVTIEAENFTTKTTGGPASGGWNIWSNGYIRNAIDVQVPGQYRLDIVARGQLAGSSLPNMRIRINGSTVTNIPVGATSYTTYTVNVNVPNTSSTVDVMFTNDYYKPSQGLDRNLIVDKVIFIKQ